MTSTEQEPLRAVYDLLRDARQCAAVKLDQCAHGDFPANYFLGDFFDIAPEKALLQEAQRLRELVAQL